MAPGMAVEQEEDKHREAPGPGRSTHEYMTLHPPAERWLRRASVLLWRLRWSALRPQADDGGVIRQGLQPLHRGAQARGASRWRRPGQEGRQLWQQPGTDQWECHCHGCRRLAAQCWHGAQCWHRQASPGAALASHSTAASQAGRQKQRDVALQRLAVQCSPYCYKGGGFGRAPCDACTGIKRPAAEK